MKISIVVPIYNVEKYLKKCIESIINQTYKNIEILLVNDGSPDQCDKICSEYEKKDKRIRTINKKNGGLSDARNKGIEQATGDYILLIDSDDTVELSMCEDLNKILEKTNADLIAFKYSYAYDNGEYKKTVDTEKYYEYDNKEAYTKLIYGENFAITAWSRIYKSSILKENNFPVGVLSEDFATAHKFFMDSKKIVFYDKTLYNYYIRNNSIMGNIKKNHAIDIYNITNEVFKFQKQNFKEHIKKINSLHYNNLLKVYYFLMQYPSDKQTKKILSDCDKQLKKLKYSEVENKTKIALFLYKNNKKLFMLVMKKTLKLR